MDKFICLNLDSYFNHKVIFENPDAFNSFKNSGDCWDKFLVSSSLPPSSETIKFRNIPFLFPDKSKSKFDNVIFENQLIKIDEISCKFVHFIGFCEGWELSDKIKFHFKNGDYFEEGNIAFKDWKYTPWNIGDARNIVVALTALDNFNTACKIYYQSINIIEDNNLLSEIELPLSPAMHIFAITLELF